MFDKFAQDISVGERYVSRGRTITESDVVMYAALSGDWNPLHTDKEWAAKGAFGERIAHGLLTLVVGAALVPVKPGVVVAFYGLDQLKFVGPVKFGDTIRTQCEVLAKEERKGDRALITFSVDVVNQREEPVMKAVFKWLCNLNPAAQTGETKTIRKP